jgi:hypothetical protein
MKPLIALGLAALLGACASSHTAPPAPDAPKKPDAPLSEKSVTQAVTTPLSDLNLVRADIPDVLRAAARNAYAPPPEKTCAAIGAAIQSLDAVLGADLDTPPSSGNPSLIERGGDAAGNAAAGALRGAAEGVIPFRGWVRKLTGAERYAREVAAAIAAGTVRRAYLKGLGEAQGCANPAAPRKTE